MVCLPHQAVLDTSSCGFPDRLDGPLHLDGHQLLEALGNGATICSSLKGDGMVLGTTRAQRGVVASILQLARHQNGSCHNSCIADRHRRNDCLCVSCRSGRALASSTLFRVGGLRDHDQCWRCGYELTSAQRRGCADRLDICAKIGVTSEIDTTRTQSGGPTTSAVGALKNGLRQVSLSRPKSAATGLMHHNKWHPIRSLRRRE